MAWSTFQEAIFSWASNPTGNLMIQAGAGTGKTTTIVEMYKRILARDPDASVLFLAFNKKIADELSNKRGVPAKTLNAFGFASVRAAFPKTKMRDSAQDKVRDLCRKYGIEYKDVGLVLRVVGLLKAYLMPLSITTDVVNSFILDYQLCEHRVSQAMLLNIRDVFVASVKMTTEIDYDDQICFPWYHKLPVRQYDFVIVDECQDLAPGKLELVAKAVGKHLICVGDPMQAIYGFCGADSESMNKIQERFNPTVLSLPVTYRCGKKIVAHVHELGVGPKDFQAGPDNHDGEVLEISKEQFNPKPKDFVLCRVTAPLVSGCFKLLERGIRANVIGKDIGKRLTDLVDKVQALPSEVMEPNPLLDWIRKSKTYHSAERAKLLAAEKDTDVLDDQMACLGVFARASDTVIGMRSKINDMFDDNVNPNAVIFSTIHKSKGLEADTVYFLPSSCKPPKNEKQRQEEANLLYVMVTRAKERAVWVR